VKNRCKKCERSRSRTYTVVKFSYLEGNKTHDALENPYAAGGKRRFRSGAPDAEKIFTVFSQKIRIFKHTLV